MDDIRELLLSEEARLELVSPSSAGPQLVSTSTKSRKVIDSEDTDVQLLARPDGTLVTEKTQTRQHEVLFDDDLPGDERLSTGLDQVDSAERIIDQKVRGGMTLTGRGCMLLPLLDLPSKKPNNFYFD